MVSIVFNLKNQEKLPAPFVSIQPTNTRWNDFGYNFHASIQICVGTDSATLKLPAYVIPIRSFNGKSIDLHSNFDSWLQRELTASGKKSLDLHIDFLSGESPRFITMLGGESAYRKLAEFVRDDALRIEILMRINELVTLRHSKMHEALTDSLLLAKQFQLGVMRTGSAFRALHRGQRYISGTFFPTAISDARRAFSFQCHLQGFKDPHSFNVNYVENEILSDRIHCLVGRNGTGKSRLLRELVLHLGNSATKTEMVTPFLDEFESTSNQISTVYVGETYNRLMTISSDSESSFPTAVRSDSRFEYYLANLHRKEGKEGGTDISTRLLVDIMRGSDSIGEKSRWQIFHKAMGNYINISDLHLPLLDEAEHDLAVKLGGQQWVNAAALNALGEQASLELFAMLDLSREVCFIRDKKEVRPSSGERMYFRFALNLLSHIDIAYVLVIDEPETHLHPNLVCDFMNLLYEVLTATKSIALIATHSAYVVREVPTHCTHVYSIDDDRVPSEKFVYLKTLGASIESISQAIFSDSNAKKFHRQIVQSMASEGKTIDELIEVYAKFISPEMLSQVADLLNKKNSVKASE